MTLVSRDVILTTSRTTVSEMVENVSNIVNVIYPLTFWIIMTIMSTFLEKITTSNVLNHDHDFTVDIFFFDADHNHVQTLGNFSIGFNIITPYLDLITRQLYHPVFTWLLLKLRPCWS